MRRAAFLLLATPVALLALAACVAAEPDDHAPTVTALATAPLESTALPTAVPSPSRAAPRAQRPVSAAAAATRAARGTPVPAISSRTTRVSGCTADQSPGDFYQTLVTAAGDDRAYRLHVPSRYRSDRFTPLVFDFHGYGRSAAEEEAYSQLVPIADRETFILVTPEGSGYPPAWDIVGVYAENGIDDVTFVAELLDTLATKVCVDTARVYATGLSNGAEMAAQVACTLPSRFAAAAPVAGVVYQGCAGGAVAVVSFHGTDDFNVPFEFTPPAMADWAAHNGCDLSAGIAVIQLSDHVTRESFAGCGAAPVVLYVVDGGGHTWPGAEDDAGGVGPTTHEINASELIWEFFRAHPKP